MDVVAMLVSLQHDEATVGVVRASDGHVRLSSSLERADGPRVEEYRPSHLGLDDDRTAVGGRLPPGAASAEVVDDAGERHVAATANGAYVALVAE